MRRPADILVVFVTVVLLGCLALGGCATAESRRGPVVVSEDWERALWKTKHCGVGMSFETCDRAWEASR
jgi:hypothetical protein